MRKTAEPLLLKREWLILAKAPGHCVTDFGSHIDKTTMAVFPALVVSAKDSSS